MEAQSFSLRLRGETKQFFELTKIPTQYPTFIECSEALQNARFELIKQGYLSASIDSLVWDDTSSKAFVIVGKKYTWAKLKNKNIPSSLLSQSRFDEKDFFNKTIEVKKVYPVFEKVIRYFEDHGYPFASVYLESVIIHDNKVSANLTLEKGPLRKIDTIILNDDSKISKQYLMQYLGLKQGMLYNESKIKNISNRIRELSFLQEASPWRIEFNVVETKLYLYVKSKSANRADVLIGLLPNNEERAGKFLLTGDIKMAFVNALGAGENLAINWQNLQYQSPRYNVDFQLPYLLKSPIGISGKFDFYKKDTSFKNVNGELGLIYQYSANQLLKLYYELASSRVLSVNIPLLQNTRSLPELGDVTYRTFGLETQLSHVDYKLNPRKGYRLLCNAGVSLRNFIKNTTIESTQDPVLNKPFSYLYDSVKIKSYKYTLRGQASYFLPLGKRTVLASTYYVGFTASTDALYKNEVFQIGGYRLLRGFDEGSMFVNTYQVISVEPRYLLSANSYFFLFGDLGFTKAKYARINKSDNPYSIGLGMTFETRAGLFNISYALGARKNQTFQFRSSKVHFGYVNYF
jgi:outer membrane protein assembly factor BamA